MMEVSTAAPPPEQVRFEVLPLAGSTEQAASLPKKVRLTVTCSPKHGPDRSVGIAEHLRALGHALTIHVAARMVRDREHLDALLSRMADCGADDLFLSGATPTHRAAPTRPRSSCSSLSTTTRSVRVWSGWPGIPRATPSLATTN